MDSQDTKPYRLGVNALIFDHDNNFLVIQKLAYKDNEWNFLGGGRDDGETLEENLFRELHEELGVMKNTFEIIGISSHKIQYDYPPELAVKVNGGKFRGQSYDQVILKYNGDKNDLVFSPEEFKKHMWVSPQDLRTHLVFPNQYSDHKKAIDEILPGLLE